MFIEEYFCLGLQEHRLWIKASKLSVLSEFPHRSRQYITHGSRALCYSYPVFPGSLCFVLRQHMWYRWCQCSAELARLWVSLLFRGCKGVRSTLSLVLSVGPDLAVSELRKQTNTHTKKSQKTKLTNQNQPKLHENPNQNQTNK